VQGTSVSLSADGNTAIVGGPGDNSNIGAAWIYTRSGSKWTQQGSKLVGTDAIGESEQGCSVSLSADGNTAIVGGFGDNSNIGAAWVYTRSGSTWTQQGSKLVGTDASYALQGCSVSLSADGNTAIVGGANDNSQIGAVWIYSRRDSTWTQQGSKLVGTGAIGNAYQGYSVSLSADGNTAIVGGINDNGNIMYNPGVGAAWIYTRSDTTWVQQGSKLVGTGATGMSEQGYSVALSADGNTAIVGGSNDSTNFGAAWVYTRSSSIWTQQGSKLVGTGAILSPQQGFSVALSADGNTAIIGGPNDWGGAGAAWVYTYIPIAGVTLLPTSATLAENTTKQLTYNIKPYNATNQAVSWVSSDTTIAKVNPTGLITAIKAGTTTIIVTTAESGYTDSCLVTVNIDTYIASITSQMAVTVYPNPASETLNINYELEQPSDVRFELSDFMGSNIAVIKLNNQLSGAGHYALSLSGEGLPNGIYLLRVVANGKVETKKVMVVR
jgi:uncharacterized protein YjdB